jgi:hypothetical protein
MWYRHTGSFLSLACLSVGLVDAWIPLHSPSLRDTTHRSLSQLEARRGKGKSLSTLAREGLVDPSPVQRPSRKTSSSASKKGSKTNSDVNISPALAEWISKNQEAESSSTSVANPLVDKSSTTASTSTFRPFEEDNSKQTKNDRRAKQSQRSQLEEARQAQLQLAIGTLEEALGGNNNLDQILPAVRGLLALPTSTSSSPRTLLGGNKRHDYRLAWVGSDDAICHIGTGLHKVPLARMQEVFWSSLGKNRVEILEVIRILGPFPNVRNTLQGTTKLSGKGDDDVSTLNIVMDTMIDGTGKQILAGTQDNIRRVDLHLYYADERVMVAVVPGVDGKVRSDPLENNGSNVLVFLREEELDDRLDALRVS